MADPATVAPRLVIAGCGFVGSALLRAARKAAAYREILATTRDPARTAALQALGASPLCLSAPAQVPEEAVLSGADVVVTYPPDENRDRPFSAACRAARKVVYVSSTAVYGGRTGYIDGATEPKPEDKLGIDRLTAETYFRSVGAVVLRAPGIYGPGRGLHLRLLRGDFRLTAEGHNHISRIHVDDLAGLCLAALRHGIPGDAQVVGDLQPVPQREVVAYLCTRLQLPIPASQPWSDAHPTLRSNRRIDPSLALVRLKYSLRFPTYRAGFEDALSVCRA